MARKLWLITTLALLALPYSGLAQSVTDAPPPIQFENWTLEADEGVSTQYRLSIPSPAPSGVRENDTIPVFAFLPRERSGPVPAVIILHYWGATDHRIEFNTARELNRRGIAGIVVSLPFHVERSPAGFRSGELAITPKPEVLVKTMTQAVLDLKRTMDWMQTRPEFRRDRVGLTGASLGSIVATLLCGVEPRITDAAFVVGGVDLAEILWKSSRVVKERDAMRQSGWTESRLREALVPIEPLNFLNANRLLNSYIVTAKHDTVIPPTAAKKLIDALPKADVLTLDTGHYGGFLIQKQVQRSVSEFFLAAFGDRDYSPPKGLNAPTVRIGVTMTQEEGIQLGAGVDLLRPRRLNDPFIDLFATPRGLQVFFGATIDRGLSAGIVATPKRVTFGAFWSIIL